MDNLEQLADDELRLRLVQYGFPNLPVTSTTRKILIKKLRHHIDSEKQKLRRESSKAARYSSGEESDGNDGRRAGQRKLMGGGGGRSHRATVGGGVGVSMPPPPPANVRASITRVPISISSPSSLPSSSAAAMNSSSFTGAANGHHHRSSNTTSRSPTSTVYISPLIVHDSEEEDYTSPVLRATTTTGSPPSLRAFGSASSSPNSHSLLFRKTGALSNITPPSANSSMYSNLGGSRDESLNESNGSNGEKADNASAGAGTGTTDSPYVSEYTKRLMQLRGETVSQENFNSAIAGGIIGGRRSVGSPVGATRYSSPTTGSTGTGGGLPPIRATNHPVLRHHPAVSPLGTAGGSIVAGNHIRQRYSRLAGAGGGDFNENDIVTHAQPVPDPPGIPFRAAVRGFIKRLDEHYGFKQTFIPCALLCLLVVFLVSVAFMYMTISTDLASTLSTIDTRYEVCGEDPGHPGTVGCVQRDDVEPALELLKLIGTELKTRVEQYHCRRDDDPGRWTANAGVMSAGEVLKYAKAHSPSVLIPQLTHHLHAMEYLIDRNPQWRISHCDAHGEPITYADVLERRATRTNHFTILKPKLPFACMIYNKFQKFFIIVGGLAVATIVALAGRYFFRFVVYVKQKRRDQVNRLISEIIHAVSQAAANAAEGRDTAPHGAGVVINHLRDRLIGTSNRRKLAWAWNEALTFLEHHESRIAFEVGNVGGEDFKMMRWIDSAPLVSGGSPAAASRLGSAGSSSAVKKWQSPAFDNSNKIHDPPTPCLKIRQMFDKYEVNDPNLKTIVQDAILEKVGGRCKIYDIQLDRSSCCVYVRCASAKDAGIVHDEINGWWFDNRLVSIKFLRLERYLQRFPRSLAGPACLKPSNKNNSSMSHQLTLNNNGTGNGGPFANGSRGAGELDTDPDEYDEGDGEEEDDDDADEDEGGEEEDHELAAASSIGARFGALGRKSVGVGGRGRSGAMRAAGPAAVAAAEEAKDE
uniref:LEM domain-containing protein n=1 Tax=Anopheles farauti TaxID=69004 RepID=A0A182QEH4_9DIPT